MKRRLDRKKTLRFVVDTREDGWREIKGKNERLRKKTGDEVREKAEELEKKK